MADPVERRVIRLEEELRRVAAASGVWRKVYTADVGTGASAAELSLAFETVPVSIASRPGTVIQCRTWGTSAGSANTRRVKVYVGTFPIIDLTIAAGVNTNFDWVLDATLTIRGASSQNVRTLGHLNTTGAGVNPALVWANVVPITESSASGLVVKMNAQTVDANDEITLTGFVLEAWSPP